MCTYQKSSRFFKSKLDSLIFIYYFWDTGEEREGERGDVTSRDVSRDEIKYKFIYNEKQTIIFRQNVPH